MKIKYFAISITIVMMSMLCGCATPTDIDGVAREAWTPEQYIIEAGKQLSQTENFTASLFVDISMGEDAYHIQSDISSTSTPLRMRVSEKTTYGDQITTSKIYLDEDVKQDTVNLYRNYEQQWTEISLTKQEGLDIMQIYDVKSNLQSVLTHGTNWVLQTSADKKVVLSGVLPISEVYDVVEYGQFLQFVGMSNMNELYFEGITEVPITITVQESDAQPVSLTIDLTQTLQTVTKHILQDFEEDDETMFDVKVYQLEFNISNINKTQNIEIPSEAYNAINYEQEIIDMAMAESIA